MYVLRGCSAHLHVLPILGDALLTVFASILVAPGVVIRVAASLPLELIVACAIRVPLMFYHLLYFCIAFLLSVRLLFFSLGCGDGLGFRWLRQFSIYSVS